jgi:formylglycine-generating enzyme required for sulfatase activity
MRLFQFSVLTMAIGGCVGTEPAIKTYNAAPTFQIQSHGEAHVFEEGENIQFYGIASDTNNLSEDLLVSWYSDQEMLCDWTVPDPSGVARCDVVITDSYSIISAQVVDVFQASGRDEINIIVEQGSAPLASIISPNDGDLYFQGDNASSITFIGQVNDLEEESGDLDIVWTSSLDGDLDLELTVTESGEISDSLTIDNLSLGNHVLTLQATDKTGKIGSSRVEFQILPPNQRPTCEILSPSDLNIISAHETLILSGKSLDEDQLSESLNIVWKSDIDGDIGVSTADSQGDFLLPLENLSLGNHNITLSVTDQYGLECSDQVFITINVPPNISILEPTTGSRSNIGDLIYFDLLIQDEEDPFSSISTTITSSLDDVLTTQYPDENGTISFNSAALSAGQHNISVTATDSANFSSVANIQLYINTPPDEPIIYISPVIADTTSDLQASINIPNDIDGDTVSVDIEWYKNEQIFPNNGVSIPSSETQKGDIWTLQAIAHDGLASSSQVTQSVIIQNSLPQINSITVSSTSPALGDTLTCSVTASDVDIIDQSNLEISYVWEDQQGDSLSTDQSIIVNQLVAVSGEIYCRVSVSDGSNVVTDISEPVLFPNLPPQIDSLFITGSLLNDSLLQCTVTASDPDNNDLDYNYVWSNLTTNQILSSNTDTVQLDPSIANPMDNISCEATVLDTYGFSDSQSQIVSLNNRSPSVNLTLSPIDALVGDIVSCIATAEDEDGDVVSIDILWYKQDDLGNQQILGSSEILSLTSVNANDQVFCEATVTDEYSISTSETQSLIVGSAGPIFISDAFVTPIGSKYNDTEVLCSGEAISDSGDISYNYKWFNDTIDPTTIIGNQSSLPLDASFAHPNDIITCEITARDLSNNTTSVSTTSITISNRSPSFASQISLPSTIYNTNTVLCDADLFDADDDPNSPSLQITYEWKINGTVVEMIDVTYNEISLSTEMIQPEDILTCTVTADDGFAVPVSNSVESTIANREATVESITIDVIDQTDDSFAFNDSELQCIVVVEDPDGDAPFLSYSWIQNSNDTTEVLQETTSTISLHTTDTSPLDEITCQVSIDDISVETSLQIENRALAETPLIVIQPENPTSNDILTCTYSEIQDPDNQSILIDYTWYKNGNLVVDAEEDTFVQTQQGDAIYCVVEFTEPHDGAIPIENSSSEVGISSAPPVISNIQFSPSTPTTSTDIVVSFDLSDSDGDENLTVDYTWFVNDEPIASASDVLQIDVSPLTEDYFQKNDVVSIEITPKDTDSIGSPMTSDIGISNTSPSPSNVNITPSIPIGGIDNLYCSYDASIDQDATDGLDVLVYTQVWIDENNTEFGTETISASLTEEDQIWTCRVSVDDGTEVVVNEATVEIASPCPLGSCTQSDDITLEDGQILNMTFKYILGGEEPLGEFQISDFYMMETEVTQEFYDAIVGIDPENPPSIVGTNYPIDNINWHNLAYLANRVTQLYNASYGTSLPECYSCSSSESCSSSFSTETIYTCTGFRLPTEWEWEYAGRSGTSKDIWTGETSTLGGYIPNASNVTILEHSDSNLNIDISEYAYNCQSSGMTTPLPTNVGSLLPNGFGLYDMHGNVAEWTHELTGLSYDYSPTRPSLNYDNPFTYPISSPNKSIIRGGRCNDDQIHMAISKRKTWTATANRPLSGGRLVRGNLQP